MNRDHVFSPSSQQFDSSLWDFDRQMTEEETRRFEEEVRQFEMFKEEADLFDAAIPASERCESHKQTIAKHPDKLRKSAYIPHPDFNEIWAAVISERRNPAHHWKLVVGWLALRYSCPQEHILRAIVYCFNRYGEEYTAGIFGFGKDQSFKWLPETEVLIPVRIAKYRCLVVDAKMFKSESARKKIKYKVYHRKERQLPECDEFDHTETSKKPTPLPTNIDGHQVILSMLKKANQKV